MIEYLIPAVTGVIGMIGGVFLNHALEGRRIRRQKQDDDPIFPPRV
jgi:hypothetical protein